MTWKFNKASDIGGRAEQQDRVEVLSADDQYNHLVVVADGMGGHHGGSLAAQAVVDIAKQHFYTRRVPDPQIFLGDMCLEAHRVIRAVGEDERRSPGSTCALLYLNGPEAYWVHVGDSRLYLYRNGELLFRTEDHSMLQLMSALEGNSDADGAHSGLQNQLFMRLGGDTAPQPEFGATEVEPEDLFLLCSDGFWTCVESHEVPAALVKHPLKDGGAAYLVDVAKARGGNEADNISLALAQWNPN